MKKYRVFIHNGNTDYPKQQLVENGYHFQAYCNSLREVWETVDNFKSRYSGQIHLTAQIQQDLKAKDIRCKYVSGIGVTSDNLSVCVQRTQATKEELEAEIIRRRAANANADANLLHTSIVTGAAILAYNEGNVNNCALHALKVAESTPERNAYWLGLTINERLLIVKEAGVEAKRLLGLEEEPDEGQIKAKEIYADMVAKAAEAGKEMRNDPSYKKIIKDSVSFFVLQGSLTNHVYWIVEIVNADEITKVYWTGLDMFKRFHIIQTIRNEVQQQLGTQS